MSTLAIIGAAFIVLPFIAEEAFFLEGAEALTAEQAGASLAETELAAETAADNPVYSIGKFEDTGGFNTWQYERLNISDWTLTKNDAWMQKIVDDRASVRFFKPSDEGMLTDPVSGEETTLGREVRQLKEAGYTKSHGLLVPPPLRTGASAPTIRGGTMVSAAIAPAAAATASLSSAEKKNDAWVEDIINKRAPVKYFAPANKSELYDPTTGRLTTFGREIKQLKDAGYREQDGLLVPP